MMKMSYIKIHRGLMDSYAFANPNHLKIWIWLLIKANYKDAYVPVSNGRGVITVHVKRGQLLFGRFKAEEELGLNGNMIYRTLHKFQDLGQIIINSDTHFSIITICKYDSYQGQENESEQAMNNTRTTHEQHMNTTRTPHEQHVNTSKEELEELEEKEELKGIIPELKTSNLFREPTIPTFEQVHEVFIHAGGTKEMAEMFYNKYDALGWYLNNSPIKNFSSLANNFITNFNKNGKQSTKKLTGQAKFDAYVEYSNRFNGQNSSHEQDF